MGSIGKDNWVHLSYTDIKMCIKGRNNILMRQNTMALALAKGFAPAVQTGVATPPQVALPQAANPAPLGGTPPLQNAGGPVGVPVLAQAHAPAPVPLVQQAQPLAVPAQAPQAQQPVPITNACSMPDTGMNTRHRCAEILTRWGTAGFLDFFDEQYNAFAPNLCSYCVGRMKEWCKEKSEDMWEGLPGCFGFEGGEVSTLLSRSTRLQPHYT